MLKTHRAGRQCALLLVLLCLTPASFAQGGLTLSEAIRRTLQNNPQLQVFEAKRQMAEGQKRSAGLSPARVVGLESENMLGSGDYQGLDQAEVTLSLSSTLELGGKRDARFALADSRLLQLDAERKAQALDLLGQMTQTYIAILALQEKQSVANQTTVLAQQTLKLVSRRVKSGAAPDAERLRAQAAVIESRLQQSRLVAEQDSQQQVLASYWSAQSADFEHLKGNLFVFDQSEEFSALFERVKASPALQVYAREARVRQADIQLAMSQSRADLNWQVGIRRLQESDDTALVAGISIPLFASNRTQGDIQMAQASQRALETEQAATLIALRSRLYSAWRAHQQAVQTVAVMQRDLLPALEQALQQTRRAYERGRYRYADWATARNELLSARLQLIDAAQEALIHQAIIEQLTAQPLSNI